MKALVGAFNQEKALVGAFSVIVKPMEHYTALVSSHPEVRGSSGQGCLVPATHCSPFVVLGRGRGHGAAWPLTADGEMITYFE